MQGCCRIVAGFCCRTLQQPFLQQLQSCCRILVAARRCSSPLQLASRALTAAITQSTLSGRGPSAGCNKCPRRGVQSCNMLQQKCTSCNNILKWSCNRAATATLDSPNKASVTHSNSWQSKTPLATLFQSPFASSPSVVVIH